MKLVIEGRLPGLNEYILACRDNKYKGAKLKRDTQDAIIWAIRGQLPMKLKAPIFLSFHWYEQNRRRDKDNIASAKKFILDALVKSERIQNDGWAYVYGFTDEFFVDPAHPRIEVLIEEKGLDY